MAPKPYNNFCSTVAQSKHFIPLHVFCFVWFFLSGTNKWWQKSTVIRWTSKQDCEIRRTNDCIVVEWLMLNAQWMQQYKFLNLYIVRFVISYLETLLSMPLLLSSSLRPLTQMICATHDVHWYHAPISKKYPIVRITIFPLYNPIQFMERVFYHNIYSSRSDTKHWKFEFLGFFTLWKRTCGMKCYE